MAMTKNKYLNIWLDVYQPPRYTSFDEMEIDFEYIWKHIKARYKNDRRILFLLHIDN